MLYGHSLGGLIVAGYLLTDRPAPDIAVLTSPALDSALPAWKKALAPVLARVVPTLAIPNGIEGDDPVARPVGRREDRGRPALCRGRHDPVRRRGRSGAEARPALWRSGGFGIPTLVLHGEDDHLVPVVGVGGLRRAHRWWSDGPIPGLRHELHNEPEGPAIIDEVIAWLRERSGTLAPQPNTASGERLGAESVAIATDPRNLIRLVPAKEAGPSTR